MVEQFPDEDQIVNGLVRPGTVQKFTATGKVVVVGPGATTTNGAVLPLQVKVGDVVMYPRVNNQIDVEGKKYNVMADTDVLVII
jgi:chaperonin GroES